MSLASPDEASPLSDIVRCDAFLEALDDQVLRVCILQKETRNLDDALNLIIVEPSKVQVVPVEN